MQLSTTSAIASGLSPTKSFRIYPNHLYTDPARSSSGGEMFIGLGLPETRPDGSVLAQLSLSQCQTATNNSL